LDSEEEVEEKKGVLELARDREVRWFGQWFWSGCRRPTIVQVYCSAVVFPFNKEIEVEFWFGKIIIEVQVMGQCFVVENSLESGEIEVELVFCYG